MIPMKIFLKLINLKIENYTGWLKLAVEDIASKFTETSDNYNRLMKIIILNDKKEG